MGERIQAAREDLLVLHELLEEARAQRVQSSELLALTRGGMSNGVLWAGTVAPDLSGAWRETFQVPFASVAFADPNQLGLTIATGEGGTRGPGIVNVPAGGAGCVPIVGTQLVVRPGTPGTFVVVVFAKPQPFSWSQIPSEVAIASSTTIDTLVAGSNQGPLTSLPAGSSAIGAGEVLDGGTVHASSLLAVELAGVATAGTVELQGSIDNVNWYPLGTLSPTAAGTSAVAGSAPARYLRADITVAFVGSTIAASVAFGDQP
ncbi:MAG: hypothetical protein ACYDDZ_10980 [Acidimicrobiales bacterium]